MFRLHGDFTAVHGQDFSQQVHQLTLDHLNIVASRKVVGQLVLLRYGYRNFSLLTHLNVLNIWSIIFIPNSMEMPSGASSNFSSSANVGLTPSAIIAVITKFL